MTSDQRIKLLRKESLPRKERNLLCSEVIPRKEDLEDPLGVIPGETLEDPLEDNHDQELQMEDAKAHATAVKAILDLVQKTGDDKRY
jgi:hypothetical protein